MNYNKAKQNYLNKISSLQYVKTINEFEDSVSLYDFFVEPYVANLKDKEKFIGVLESFENNLASIRVDNPYNAANRIAKKLKNTESKYVHHRLHVYSRMLIDFCVEKKAGTIVILDQEEKIEIAKEERFVLRNWSYYELINKIKYKADKAGIELITA